jgi:hypothetical protein
VEALSCFALAGAFLGGMGSIPVFVDGLDENEFERALIGDAVDGAIGDVEPDGTMSRHLRSRGSACQPGDFRVSSRPTV